MFGPDRNYHASHLSSNCLYILTIIRVSSHLTQQSEPITACPVFSGQLLQKDNSMTEVVLLPFEIVLLT